MNCWIVFLIFAFAIPAFADDVSDKLRQFEMQQKLREIEHKADWERREQRSREYMRNYEDRREKNQREIDDIIDESNRTRFELDMQHRLNEIDKSR